MKNWMSCGMRPSATSAESVASRGENWRAVKMVQENPLAVALGTHVTVELIAESGTGESLAFDLVPDEQADFVRGFLGVGTPLAQALVGMVAGESVVYRLGDVVS